MPGEGPFDADLMIVGEAPWTKEDETGLPFAGDTGKILDSLLAEAGLDRERAFITNTVKCKEKPPTEEQMSTCRHWLESQIWHIQPKLIMLLGKNALSDFFPKYRYEPMSRMRGQFLIDEMTGRTFFVTYHTSALINPPHDKDEVVRVDFKVVANYMKVVRV